MVILVILVIAFFKQIQMLKKCMLTGPKRSFWVFQLTKTYILGIWIGKTRVLAECIPQNSNDQKMTRMTGPVYLDSVWTV